MDESSWGGMLSTYSVSTGNHIHVNDDVLQMRDAGEQAKGSIVLYA